MRIIHFSDFHLAKETLNSSKLFVINPLLKTLAKINEEQKIDLVLFSGDLIDKAGESFGGPADAFMAFYEEVITPVCKTIGITDDRFIIAPGNHDVNRSLDSSVAESGCRTLVKPEEINPFIQAIKAGGDRDGAKRVAPFKAFEEVLYTVDENCKLTYFESIFKFKIDGAKIGVAALNSSWRCYDNFDKGRIYLGEQQIVDSLNELEDCSFKIALSHHCFDQVSEEDRKSSGKLVQAKFDILLCGHVHTTTNQYVLEPKTKLLTLIAPGTLSKNSVIDSKESSNGFSTIDIDLESSATTVTFYIYNHPDDEFSLNNIIVEGGVWDIVLPKSEKVAKITEFESVLATIKQEHGDKLNKNLLSYNTDSDAPKSLDNLFVHPKLVLRDDIKDDKEVALEDLNSILSDDRNYLFFGTKESGKTTLLHKILNICLSPNDDFERIPVYLEFSKISTDVVSNIRDFLAITKDATKKLLDEHQFIILLDELAISDSYSDLAKIHQLGELLLKFPKTKVIATYKVLFINQIPEHFEGLARFDFVTAQIREFQSKQIRALTTKWFNDSPLLDKPKKLETIINAFLALSLPRTPFAVSMFLWIIEKQENFKPINNATLIETFIEKLLNKQSPTEALSDRFNYQNKVRLLADLAHMMLTGGLDNYSETHANTTTFVSNYLSKRDFDYNVEIILNDLVSSGILLKEDNNIRFRFTCFFEYFLVKKMTFDPKFLNYVLDESNYLNFANEIDYYTGLHRDNSEILKTMTERTNESFKTIRKDIDALNKGVDDFFMQEVSNINIPEDKVSKIIPTTKATEQDYEAIEDRRLEGQTHRSDITKKESVKRFDIPIENMLLTLKVLKNCEEIEVPNLKYHSYTAILTNSIYFAIFYKFFISTLIEKKLIPDKNKKEQFEILQFLPVRHVDLLYMNMGTHKLAPIFLRKILADEANPNISDFERYMSIFLYAEVRGKESLEKLEAFITRSSKKYILDMTFVKVGHYYAFRSKTEESDLRYLNMIGDILIKAKSYKKETKSKLMENYKVTKKLQKENP